MIKQNNDYLLNIDWPAKTILFDRPKIYVPKTNWKLSSESCCYVMTIHSFELY